MRNSTRPGSINWKCIKCNKHYDPQVCILCQADKKAFRSKMRALQYDENKRAAEALEKVDTIIQDKLT